MAAESYRLKALDPSRAWHRFFATVQQQVEKRAFGDDSSEHCLRNAQQELTMLGVTDYGAFVIAFLILLAIPGPGNFALITATGKGGISSRPGRDLRRYRG